MRYLLIFTVVFLVVVSGCARKEKADDGSTRDSTATPEDAGAKQQEKSIETHKMLKGVALTPRAFDTSGFMDFINKAGQAGTVISWAGDWKEITAKKSAPFVVADLAPKYGFTPVFEVQFFDQSKGSLLRPLDENNRKMYLDSIVAFAGQKNPEYLGVGIEVNLLAEDSPADFEEFVTFYAEVYDALKAASPETKVFTIFQLERMKGLKGGLFGGNNDPKDTQWDLLARFPKSDIAAFTTYPHLVFKNPDDIPLDYYSEIASKTDKQIAFSEVGWFSSSTLEGWDSSEAAQARFVDIFFNATKDINPEFAIWGFLYDQDIPEPFRSVGLVNSDGTAKEAWTVWVSSG
jgi:hypothetical protein